MRVNWGEMIIRTPSPERPAAGGEHGGGEEEELENDRDERPTETRRCFRLSLSAEMNTFLLLLLSSMTSVAAATVVHEVHVDCQKGDDAALGTAAAPFATVHRAQNAVRALRRNQCEQVVVNVKGVCELAATLTLGAADSNTRYVGAPGAMLSAGTTIPMAAAAAGADEAGADEAGAAVTVDLTKHGFSAANLGALKMRGYAGGSACIDVQNFEPSAAELFFRPAGAASAAGARAYGASDAASGRMRLARFPNAAPGVPAAADWAGISAVDNLTLTVDAFSSKLAAWNAELKAGTDVMTHGALLLLLLLLVLLPAARAAADLSRRAAGLWKWNWADSHRSVSSISSSSFVVNDDDINRDVGPIVQHKGSAQGGYLYAYNLLSELDVAGEYFIEKQSAKLSFMPPSAAAAGADAAGTYSVSRLTSAVVASGASNVTLEGLEIRYARGAGVVVSDSTSFVVKGCTISDHGMMGTVTSPCYSLLSFLLSFLLTSLLTSLLSRSERDRRQELRHPGLRGCGQRRRRHRPRRRRPRDAHAGQALRDALHQPPQPALDHELVRAPPCSPPCSPPC